MRKQFANSIGLFLSVVLAGCSTAPPSPVSACPQPRRTVKAPDEYYRLKDPLRASQQALKAAERLYSGRANMSCATCHGERGDGQGPLAGQFDPPPRNFACQTVSQIPDGQLFWVIRFGSPGTAMPAHAELSDEQIWELVLYLRQLAPQAGQEPAVHS